MENSTYTCIVCPVSCTIEVSRDKDGYKTSGNQCRRGERYAIAEHTEPVRMVTTTVVIKNAALPRLPVISEREIPKAKMKECLQVLYGIEAEAPVVCGDVVLENICGTGVNILAARTLGKK